MSMPKDHSEAELIALALMDHNWTFYLEVEEQLKKMGFETFEEKRWLCNFCLSIGMKNSHHSDDDAPVIQNVPTPPSLVANLKLPELITTEHFDIKEFEKKFGLIKGFYNLGLTSGLIDLAKIALNKSEFKEFVGLTLIARESYGLYKSQINENSYISYRAKFNGMLAHFGKPKQKEKSFIKDCWLEWKKDPSRYKSKAEFARDMLEKCDHLTSTDKICRWCNLWDKELTP